MDPDSGQSLSQRREYCIQKPQWSQARWQAVSDIPLLTGKQAIIYFRKQSGVARLVISYSNSYLSFSLQHIGDCTVCCNSKLGLSLSYVSVYEEKNTPMISNLVCASRSAFAAGVKAHCASWQQGLNSPPLPLVLQELATVLPMYQLLRRDVSNCSNMLELALYSWCI